MPWQAQKSGGEKMDSGSLVEFGLVAPRTTPSSSDVKSEDAQFGPGVGEHTSDNRRLALERSHETRQEPQIAYHRRPALQRSDEAHRELQKLPPRGQFRKGLQTHMTQKLTCAFTHHRRVCLAKAVDAAAELPVPRGPDVRPDAGAGEIERVKHGEAHSAGGGAGQHRQPQELPEVLDGDLVQVEQGSKPVNKRYGVGGWVDG